MNILGRITARWLVGLVAVLTVLAHVSDAGRMARSGYDIGQAILSSGDLTQPVLASEAPRGEIRIEAGDRQPHVGGKAPGDAVPSATPAAIVPDRARTAHPTRPATPVRAASFVPGQRAPPLLLRKA